MDDDLNTADAISVIFELVTEANKSINAEKNPSEELCGYAYDMIKELGGVLGLLEKDGGKTAGEEAEEIEKLLEERKLARLNKDWKTSDELRDKLKTMGYIVKDTAMGQQLVRE